MDPIVLNDREDRMVGFCFGENVFGGCGGVSARGAGLRVLSQPFGCFSGRF